MASFDEYRKKMNSKYGNKKDEEEEKNKKETMLTKTSSSVGSFDSYRKKMESKYNPSAGIDNNYINAFLSESENFLKSSADDYDSMVNDYSSDIYGSRLKTANDLQKRSFAISQYLDENKDRIDEETLNNFKSYLDEFDKASGKLRYEFYKANERNGEELGVLGSDDYKEYSQKGASIENPTMKEAEGFANIFGWRPGSKDIENIVTYSRENADALRMGAANNSKLLGDFRYSHMTDNEVGIYNYYLAKYGEDKANEYLKSIDDELDKREAGKMAEVFDDNVFLESIMGFSAGVETSVQGIKGLADYVTGNTSGTDYSANQYADQIVASNNEGILKGIHDVSSVIGGMTPSILASTITGNPLVGATVMGGSAMGNAYNEMIDLGYDKWQARGYGFLVGASETVLQYALGGISKLGGKLTGNAIGKVVATLDNALARTAIQLGGNMASEGLEEAIQTILEPAFKSLVTGEEFDAPKWEDIWYSALLGALSAGLLEGVPTIKGTTASSMEAKNIYGSDPQALITEAIEIDPTNAHAQRMQAKLDGGKDISGYQLNRLVEANEQTLLAQDTAKMKSAVEARLTEVGETGDIGKLADVIVKAQSGEKLTTSERRLLTESKYGRRVSTELNPQSIESGQYTSKWAENLGTERINTEAYNKRLYDLASEKAGIAVSEEKIPVSVNASEKEIATESEFKASEDGKTKIGDTEVSIKEIASVKNGNMILRLEDGSTVNARDVEYGSNAEGLLYENVVHMGLNATSANAFINGYEGNMPVAEYALDFRQAYRYGELGIPKIEMNSERFVSNLSPSVKDLAYNLGAIDAKYKASEKAKITSIGTINADKDSQKGKKKGKLHNTLTPTNETQRASLKTLRAIAETLGIDIYTFESPTDSKGRRLGSNGWYNPKDNSIHIDLFAGADGKGTLLFTAAHELTHHIREKLPAKFKAFSDFLFEQYGEKGISVAELIEKKRAFLEEKGRITPDMTEAQAYDLAYEEVIADACESFLADGDAVAKIAELKAKDKTLWQTIKDFFTKLVARIKAAYEGLSPDSVEGRLVAEMLDSAEKLKAMWTEMLVEASEIVNIDTKTESVSPMFSERTWTESEYVTEREKTAKAISQTLNVDIKTAYKYIDDINGVARLIADDRARLDYEPNLDEKATVLKPNSEYKYSVDMSTLCAKRLLFTGTFDAIQRALPNTVFDSEDIVSLREMMQKRGYEVACGICYVESTRREIGRITQDFIDSYKESQKTGKPITRINSEGKAVDLKKTKDQKETTADKSTDKFFAEKDYTPTLADLNTTDIDLVKRDHPLVYEAYLNFMNARGQAKPKLLETRAEYKGEILKHFKAKTAVNARNNAGGLRLQSFSDFEVPHMIDMMQIVMDMSRVGLKSQAYTKVPAFAEIFGDSGVKINLSLIAKGDGLDANGNLVFDDVEGINHKEAFKLRDKYTKNVGTILVGKTDAHIIAAMADPRIDYIIPFHKSSWKESLYDALGLTGYADYTDFQNEKPLDKDRKIKNFDPSEYWDFTKSGDENAQIYLAKCREDGRIPKFPQFQGYPGYWKLLIDFKMYDNNGVGSPQEVVKPIFNTAASERILGEYKGGHKSFPVAKDVVEDFVKEHKEVKYSDRDSFVEDKYFKSQMSKWEDLKHGSYVKVGTIGKKHPLYSVGMPEGTLRYDVDKLKKNMVKHGDYLDVDLLKAIPDIIANPIAISEFSAENTVSVFGNIFVGNSPMMVGVTVSKDRAGNDISKVRTYNTRRDVGKLITDETILYLNEDKKRTRKWFQACGIQVPLGETKFGFIRSISQNSDFVKRKFSDRSSYAPTFYSYMGKVIDDIKLDKMGAGGVVSYLKGKGVKNEEIKWSGIEAFLEGKKSVTKAELQEFVAGSQLQIVEQVSGEDIDLRYDGSDRAYNLYDSNGTVVDTFTYNEFLGGYVAESDEEIYLNEIELREALREAYGKASAPKWADYKLDGGSNYRELVFQLPNSSYSNRAMRVHWGQDTEGVLVHARIQDFNVNGKKMLFIEELQSDWHNEGHAKGYTTKEYEEAVEVYEKLAEDYANKRKAFNKYVRSGEFRSDPDEVSKKKFDWLRGKMETAEKRMQDAERDVEALKEKGMGDVPDAPFRDTYHEYVLKRLLRMAAEEGYDSIGWTPADIQSERWSDEFAEGYRIEYDQDIPKFLKKYGKKWGATVGKTAIEGNGEITYTSDGGVKYNSIREWFDSSKEAIYLVYGDHLKGKLTVKEEGTTLYVENKETGERYPSKLFVHEGNQEVWSMSIPDSMTESVLYEGQVMYSDRVTDKKTLNFLENQEHITTYKSFVEIDGKLYSPMATKVKGEDGKYHLTNPSELGVWQQAEENPDSIPKFHKSGYGYYVLKKDDGGSVTAAYNPYEHSSNLVLNDQFESAYQRPNLVTVECVIPKSEMTSGYKAKYAKDSTGYLDWKSGTVAGKLKGNKRKVYLSRWLKPVRIVSDAEVASMYKELLGSNISVPFNVVTPQLLTELEKVGVKIDYEGSPGYQYRQSKKQTDDGAKYSDRNPDSISNRTLLANALESVAQNDIERNKLTQYKQKISLIEAEQAKLAELRAEIKELSFAKGRKDTARIKELQFEANQTANRINTYDRQLLTLESTTALKGVIEREKQMAYKKAMKEGKEALTRQKERAAKTQKELLTRYQESRKKGIEGRHKTEMRYKIKTVVNELNQYLTKGTKDKHVPIELQKAVAEALDAVNMDTVGAEERIAKKRAEMMVAKTPEAIEKIAKEIGHIEEMGGNMAKKISRLKTAYDSIINSDDPLIANSHDAVISNTIDKVIEVVGETPLRDMSLYQLEAVYDMYRMVLTTIRNTNKAFKAAKGEEISIIANGVISELMDKKKKSPYSTKGTQAMSEFNWNNYKPIYAFERIGSANFTKVFKAVREGEDVWAKDMSEAKAFREEQFKQHKYDSWDFKKRYGFTSTSGIHFELSLDQILSLYAFSKREQAGDHLKYGGFVFDGLTEVKVKNKVGATVTYQLKDATAYNLSEETLAEIIDKLTPEQKAFADAMQDYLSTVMGEKGNEVSLALYDIKLFKEKNYFPLKSAPQYMAKAKEQAQGEVKIKNSGFTKETTPKAKNPIVLSSFMDVWASHVNEMSMYHAFTLPLEDFYRVYNYHTPANEKMEMVSVGASLENAHGQAAVKYIDQLLKDLNGGARSDPRETLGKSLMSNFKKASVMASMSVVVQQPTAIVRAMALVDSKYFVGKKATKGKHKEVWAEVKKYAPVAVIKEMGYFDTGMGQGSVEWLKGEKTFMDKVDDATSKLPALADEVTWVAIWNAVKRETVHTHKHLQPNSEEFLKAVGERFTEVVTKTQVYDSTLARSANMRSKSALMNMWTSFMAEPTTSINMLQDAFHKGNKKYIARALGAVYGSVVLNSALVSIIYAMRDDDDDETFLEKYLSRFTTEVIDGVNPLTNIPFFKDIWSLLQGFDVERVDMSLINDVIDSLQQMVKVISKDTSNMDEDELAEHKKAVTEAILSITDNLSSLVGVPVKNIRRDVNGIINAIKTIGQDLDGRETSAGSLGDNILEDVKDSVPGWGWFPDESKGDKLYDAIIKGDTAYIDRLKGAYKSDTAYQSALRKALRENDPRIKKAAVARYNGDISEYMRIAKEIIAEGNFKQDDIVAAINTEINAMKKGEETTESATSNKATSIYKVDDYYAALVGRDQATAYVVKEDLIKTDVANGKDRDEAEGDFNDKFTSYLKDKYEEGELSDYEAEEMLVNYGGKSEEEATAKIQYWSFKKEYPDINVDDSWITEYYADGVADSGISIKMFVEYRNEVKGITGEDKKARRMDVIDSLPISSSQKDALYFAEGWTASKLWEAPWH